ncbi:MAG: MAPEG family protein [Pseudomonadales bacterium]|nr:MAPEG family protein [Pseudomonadales bacterium]
MPILSHDYYWALLGIAIILITLFIQWLFATGSKGALPDAIPGKTPEDIGHESFIYRSNRTFMNSLENISMMLGSSFLAIFSGTHEFWTAVCIWTFACARIVHMLLYYFIATEKNPSPRSYFFGLGLAANLALLTLTVIHLISLA